MPSHLADTTPRVVRVDTAVLAAHPLPALDGETSKHERGTVVVVGAACETVGATLLAAIASLRAGAGKLRVVTDDATTTALGVAIPEARVIGAQLDPDTFSASTFDGGANAFDGADAVLVGPGTLTAEHACALVRAVVPHLGDECTLVLDAGAVAALGDAPPLDASLDASRDASLRARTIAIPNPVEAAHVLGDARAGADGAKDDPDRMIDALVDRLGVTVALRDAVTRIGTPDGARFVDESGHAALATSGSGDVLAGILAGLAARGARPLDALLWAVHAHGVAGERLAAHHGGVGLLARDLLDVVPLVLNDPSICT
jgi:hydroxyethylthiazole kinase-like uncharacterized protein yjeF